MKHYVEVAPGVELLVEQHGTGSPLVFVHGLFGITEHWQYQFTPFARDRFVLAYDCRGSGRSAKPASEIYPIEQHATDLASILDAAGIDRAVVVGHSMGSCIAIAFALRFADRVSALCLVDGFACGEHCVVNLDKMRDDLDHKAALVELFKRVSFGASFSWSPDSEAISDWAAYEATKLPVEAVIASARGFTEYDAREKLGEITVPALVVVGDQDWSCPLDPSSRFISEHLGGPTSLSVLHSGHFPMLEVPAEFNERLAAWLASVTDGSTPEIAR